MCGALAFTGKMGDMKAAMVDEAAAAGPEEDAVGVALAARGVCIEEGVG